MTEERQSWQVIQVGLMAAICNFFAEEGEERNLVRLWLVYRPLSPASRLRSCGPIVRRRRRDEGRSQPHDVQASFGIDVPGLRA